MKKILTLSVVAFFMLSFLTGCSTHTLERVNVEMKKQQSPQIQPNMKKDDDHGDDEEKGPGNSDFGHSHMKPEIKKKYEENKEKVEHKQENKKNKKEHNKKED